MFSLFAFFCAVVLYFAPAIVAHHRRHESSGGIFLVNLLLGWSIIGWIGKGAAGERRWRSTSQAPLRPVPPPSCWRSRSSRTVRGSWCF